MSAVVEDHRLIASRGVAQPAPLPRRAAPLERPALRQRAGYLLANPWKNYLLPAAWLRRLVSRSASPLIAESLIRPGGWRSMEIIYRNHEPLDWFDRQALRDNPISMAARNRRRIVTARLAELIREYGERGPVSLLGIGAGPGQHLQHALVDSAVPSTQASIWLVDLDPDAFGYGRRLAASLGIPGAVHFLQGDARAIRDVLPGTRMEIVKLVGLVEYLSDREVSELLRSLRGIISRGGALVTHGLTDPHGCSRFLERVFGLRHWKRSARQMSALLKASGFQVVNCVTEPVGVYPILTAMPSD